MVRGYGLIGTRRSGGGRGRTRGRCGGHEGGKVVVEKRVFTGFCVGQKPPPRRTGVEIQYI